MQVCAVSDPPIAAWDPVDTRCHVLQPPTLLHLGVQGQGFRKRTCAPTTSHHYRNRELNGYSESLSLHAVACRRGIYPGHGHEIVEVSVARAHCGTASLPRHLHGSYQHAAPHPWPLAPSTDQVHPPHPLRPVAPSEHYALAPLEPPCVIRARPARC